MLRKLKLVIRPLIDGLQSKFSTKTLFLIESSYYAHYLKVLVLEKNVCKFFYSELVLVIRTHFFCPAVSVLGRVGCNCDFNTLFWTQRRPTFLCSLTSNIRNKFICLPSPRIRIKEEQRPKNAMKAQEAGDIFLTSRWTSTFQ